MKKNKIIQNDSERIEQLLNMAWETSSPARELAIANQVLEINPDNISALLLKAGQTEDPNKCLEILQHALNALDKPGSCEPDEKGSFFILINSQLASLYTGLDEFDNAYKHCESVLKFCEENPDEEEKNIELGYDDTMIKALFYRALIERRDWQKILEEAMRDTKDTLGRAYARLIAAWFLGGQNAKKICANLLWDVLRIAPDVPFYMVGFIEEPSVDVENEELEDFNFALMYYDTISITDEFFNWFSRGVILFGLLSGRFEEKERDYLIDVLDNLGGYDEYQKMKDIIVETEDSLVLEALAANKCLTE